MGTTKIWRGNIRGGWSGEAFWRRLGLLVFAAIVLGPLLALLIELLGSLLNGNTEWLSLALPTGRRLMLLLRSVGLAASVAAGGVVLGLLGGSILWRWHAGLLARLRWLILILAPIPPYIHALAWSSAATTAGGGLLEGWPGTWWVQLMSLAPIAVGLTLLALESVDPALIDAARPMRSDIGVLAKVVVPLAAPVIIAGGGLLFLLSLLDYSVPSLLQVNVYSLEIFAEYSASAEPARALLLALPLVVISVAVVFAAQAMLRHVTQRQSWRVPAWQAPPAWPVWFICLQWVAGIALVAQMAVPVVSLIAELGSWGTFASAVASAGGEIPYSFVIALVAAFCCLPLAYAVARTLVSSGSRGWWWVLILAPLAIPPALTGIGLISVWNHPMPVDVYASSAMPVLAAMARFTPLAAMVLLAQLLRTDPLLIDAARVAQTNSWQTWIGVRLPLLAPGLLAGAGIMFALTLGELGATLLVAPPGQATLTMRIYNLLHYGASGDVAGLCLMMAVAALVAGTLAATALALWSRLSQRIRAS